MIPDSRHSVSAYTSLEALTPFDGFEEMTYLSTFLESTGDEPPSLRITPNSTFPYWGGTTGLYQHSSSTRYQWRELYAAWKLAIPLPNSQEILVFPKKGEPYTVLMDSVNWIIRLRENLRSTASTMSFYVKKYSSD